MKILLISDTHGNIKEIDSLAKDVGADLVIHSGDFGLYNNESCSNLSLKELNLLIKYSNLSNELKDRLISLNRREKENEIISRKLLGNFQSYLEGKEKFKLPIYFVWGNHEDREIVRKIRSKEITLQNFYHLDENNFYNFKNFRIVGLGGNVLSGEKFFQSGLSGGNGKIWSNLDQFERLIDNFNSNKKEKKINLVVTHVSPGKDPLILLLATVLGANFTISGHMGTPHCNIWNEFTVRDIEDSKNWIKRKLDELLKLEKFKDKLENSMLFKAFNENDNNPLWHRNFFNINLPDFGNGYAILEMMEDQLNLNTFSKNKIVYRK